MSAADCVKLADFGLSRWIENDSYYKVLKLGHEIFNRYEFNCYFDIELSE